MALRRVYLDQNHWIGFSAAREGLNKGDPYRDALVVAEAGVRAGLLSFPLSNVHYMETGNRRHWDSRRNLADTMARVSRYHAIAPFHAILPAEIEHALHGRFGRPISPLPLQPFGYGVDHAFARKLPRLEVPALAPLGLHVQQGLDALREWAMLAGPPPEAENQLEDYEPNGHRRHGIEMAVETERLRQLRRAEGWTRGERAGRAAKFDAFAGAIEPFNAALERGRLSADVLYALGRDGMTALLEEIPTMYIESELRRLRHQTSQKPWEANDLLDIVALSVALVHCDVVVTERTWATLVNREGLAERFGTQVLSRPSDIAAALSAV